MNLFKHKFYLLLAVLIIVGCSASKKPKQQEMIFTEEVSEPENEINLNEVNELKLIKQQKNNWQHLDLEKDSVAGMSVNKAYAFLQGKTGQEVIVGVIDTGVDFNHEDLKDVAWINKDEIAGNGIDDDKNGYIDDINGWNFIGKMEKAHFESDRILANPSLVDTKTFAKLKKEQAFNVEMAKERSKSITEEKIRAEQMLQTYKNADAAFTKHFGKKDYTKEEVLKIKTTNEDLKQHISFAKTMFEYGVNSMQEIKSGIEESIKLINNEYNRNQQLISGKVSFEDYRKILGDNPNDINDTNYGDGNIQPMSNDEMHGSHVSGIIAAKRNNGEGINGIADNAKIMSIRAVPNDGDEHDKDVALAIRYAVDNGAKVINGSFGKSYSPHKKWVYDAIKYAAKKDVLIINAAGNDGDNIDKIISYPNDVPNNLNEIADNFMLVGANNANYNNTLAADFSNYGKRNVDVFAPGVEIYATIPNNKYEPASGTSMAAPCVAGVAALIRSYYPELTASQVKHILMNSGRKINLKVATPFSMSSGGIEDDSFDEGGMLSFSDLSVSGSIVNAYKAVKMADEMTKVKK